MNPEQIKKLQESQADAFQRLHRLEADAPYIPETRLSDFQIHPGELLIVPTAESLSAWWCAVFSHPRDEKLWFLVPGDEFPLIGTADFPVPASPIGCPLNFRCGCGIWVHRDDLRSSRCCGRLDHFNTEAIHDHVAQIAANRLSYDQDRIETDELFEYQEWMTQVQSAADSWSDIVEASHAEAEIFFVSDASDAWAAEVDLHLALAASTVAVTREPAKGFVIGSDGRVVALVAEGGVHLRISETDDLPKVVVGEITKRNVGWNLAAGCAVTELLPWEHDAVTLLINSRKVVVRK
ncbi:MAG: hypothetical protein U0892_16795 [Pirellulales bacterium]